MRVKRCSKSNSPRRTVLGKAAASSATIGSNAFEPVMLPPLVSANNPLRKIVNHNGPYGLTTFPAVSANVCFSLCYGIVLSL